MLSMMLAVALSYMVLLCWGMLFYIQFIEFLLWKICWISLLSWTTQGESKTIIPLTTASKRIKYFRINLTKETKVLYMKNYKTLLKDIREHTYIGRNLWSGIFNSTKMWIQTQVIGKFSAIPIKICVLFCEKLKSPC